MASRLGPELDAIKGGSQFPGEGDAMRPSSNRSDHYGVLMIGDEVIGHVSAAGRLDGPLLRCYEVISDTAFVRYANIRLQITSPVNRFTFYSSLSKSVTNYLEIGSRANPRITATRIQSVDPARDEGAKSSQSPSPPVFVKISGKEPTADNTSGAAATVSPRAVRNLLKYQPELICALNEGNIWQEKITFGAAAVVAQNIIATHPYYTSAKHINAIQEATDKEGTATLTVFSLGSPLLRASRSVPGPGAIKTTRDAVKEDNANEPVVPGPVRHTMDTAIPEADFRQTLLHDVEAMSKMTAAPGKGPPEWEAERAYRDAFANTVTRQHETLGQVLQAFTGLDAFFVKMKRDLNRLPETLCWNLLAFQQEAIQTLEQGHAASTKAFEMAENTIHLGSDLAAELKRCQLINESARLTAQLLETRISTGEAASASQSSVAARTKETPTAAMGKEGQEEKQGGGD
ncbi:MAG: hypothetical protein M1837_001821 [Sclerophora amabilis]|nr:MAG: hypothetical protein M1837_001821 [Sclerophora amabilis]